jgi:hypothetical protein
LKYRRDLEHWFVSFADARNPNFHESAVLAHTSASNVEYERQFVKARIDNQIGANARIDRMRLERLAGLDLCGTPQLSGPTQPADQWVPTRAALVHQLGMGPQ